jgi:hypothetical protein
MAFELIDQLSLPGDAAKVNEDAFGHDAGAAVVLDGATPLFDESTRDPLMPGSSDAAWIATFGSRRLLAHLRDGMGARKALRGALGDAEKSFKALRRGPPEDVWQTPCASMMLAVQDEDEIEFLWFGDCAALLKQEDGPVTVIGETLDKKASESATAAKAAKASNQPATERQHHMDGLRARRNRINSGDYWLFSPDVRAATHVSRRVVKTQAGAQILLCSDGFLALASDYGAYNADTLMVAVLDRGLAALGEELRATEDGDPLGAKFPRFKKSDDATAVLLRLT